MSDTEETTPTSRTGSYADLARRVDRVEQNVASLMGAVKSVELNQQHADKITDLRFTALDKSIGGVETLLTSFMVRVEGIISGEIQTAQQRAGAEMVRDYMEWRKSVDERMPDENEVVEYRLWRQQVDVFMTQGRTIATLVKLAVAGNFIAIVAGIAAILKP